MVYKVQQTIEGSDEENALSRMLSSTADFTQQYRGPYTAHTGSTHYGGATMSCWPCHSFMKLSSFIWHEPEASNKIIKEYWTFVNPASPCSRIKGCICERSGKRGPRMDIFLLQPSWWCVLITSFQGSVPKQTLSVQIHYVEDIKSQPICNLLCGVFCTT